MTAQTIWYEVFDLHRPAPEPFAVIKIDTSIRKESGVEGTIVSLHMNRAHAADTARALTERELQGISSQ